MNVRKFFAATALFLTFFSTAGTLLGQVHSSSSYKYLLDEKNTLQHLEFLTSPELAGRAAGTSQAKEVADYIAEEFKEYGLEPFRGISFYQPFKIEVASKRGGRIVPSVNREMDGYNVIGYAPARSKNANYIIVGAHFDHMGSLGEKFFPGADDNASGVTALLELAKAYGKRYREKNDLKHHIVFVAFDGNNHNLQGSRAFVQRKGIEPYKVNCMVNIDQIGSTLTPVGEFDEYIQVLGGNKLDTWQKEQLDFANEFFGLGLCIDYSYYGSQQFYDIFYRLSDQQSFTEVGIPALLFTSGITKHTNKESDTVGTLSLGVLQRRIELIYRFLWLID